MPKRLDPNATVRIPCPTCGDKRELKISEVELSPRLRCTECGTTFQVDGRKIIQRIQALESQRRV